MDVKQNTHVAHEIAVSQAAFEQIVKAIASLSLEQGRFVKFKDVLLYALATYQELKEAHAAGLVAQLPVDGPIRIYVRLNSKENAAVERLKGELSAKTKVHCGVRETLVFCALLVAQGEFSTCKIPVAKITL